MVIITASPQQHRHSKYIVTTSASSLQQYRHHISIVIASEASPQQNLHSNRITNKVRSDVTSGTRLASGHEWVDCEIPALHWYCTATVAWRVGRARKGVGTSVLVELSPEELLLLLRRAQNLIRLTSRRSFSVVISFSIRQTDFFHKNKTILFTCSLIMQILNRSVK